MRRATLIATLLALLAGFAFLPPPERASAGSTVGVTIDGAQQYQTIDGFGVNINPKNWNDGELIPALDLLIDQLGAKLFRVDPIGKSDWEANNDDTNPNTFNWTYYNTLYETPQFQELWSTLDYLNSKDVEVIIGISGVVPAWMGDTAINVSDEDEWVEMIASLVYYARNTRGIDFPLLSPINETNIGAPEGPLVGTTQYARIIHDLVVRLQALGLGDIEIMPPESAGIATEYVPELLADSTIMARVQHFAYHNYHGSTGDAHSTIKNSAYPDRDFWMTEWSQTQTDGWLDAGAEVADEWAFAAKMTDFLFNHVRDGAAAALAWDAYDNIHVHNPGGEYTHWGVLAYDLESGAYTPKARFYTNAQFFKFVPAGSVRFDAALTVPPGYEQFFQTLAFRHPATGRLTLVGQNIGDTPLTLNGTLTNVPTAPTTLALYRSSSSLDLARQANVTVSGGSFSVQVPGDSFFTLTGTPGAAEATPPALSNIAAVAVSTTGAAITWNTNEVADSRAEWGLTASYGQSTVFDAALITSHQQKLTGLLPNATYHYRVRSSDASGNATISSDHTFTTTTAPPTLTVTFDDLGGQDQPLNGQYPSGVIDWGTNTWFHAAPFGLFTTKSLSFNGPSITSGTLTLLTPRRPVSIRAYNGGSATAIVTLSCPGQLDKRAELVKGEIATILTGWAGNCASVTIASTNGWDTNFDTLVFTSGGGAPQGPDADGDGCSDAAEQQTAPGSQVIGGRRDPNYLWDFIDQYVGSPAAKDRVVAAGDIGAIVARYGAAGNPNGDPLTPPIGFGGYHTSADRNGAIPGQSPWNAQPPDGVISAGDIAGVVAQYGHSCA